MTEVTLRGDKKCPHGHTARRKCDTCDREDDQAEIERLRAALEQVARIKAFPDATTNLVTISAMRQIAEKALRPEPQSGDASDT